MKKPNFFILGAPKCGTTALAAWLAEHPEVFFSPIKEPHHFDTDQPIGIKGRADYEALFSSARSGHAAVGEASVRYLHSKVAVDNILRYTPNARFIAMVRNPIEMAPALHEQRLFTANEDVTDFERAWNLQSARRDGEHIPRFCEDPAFLQYGTYCQLGTQLKRVMDIVRRENLLVIFHDDLKEDASRVYKEVLYFLSLPHDGRVSFAKINAAKRYKYRWASSLIRGGVSMRRKLGFNYKSFGIANKVSQWNRVERKRDELSKVMRDNLLDYFLDEIRLLEELTNRNLSHWVAL